MIDVSISVFADLHVNDIYEIAGRIYLAKEELDRETLDTHVISVSAFSSNQEAAKILGTVTVAVLDTNDNKPTFSQVQRERWRTMYGYIFYFLKQKIFSIVIFCFVFVFVYYRLRTK